MALLYRICRHCQLIVERQEIRGLGCDVELHLCNCPTCAEQPCLDKAKTPNWLTAPEEASYGRLVWSH